MDPFVPPIQCHHPTHVPIYPLRVRSLCFNAIQKSRLIQIPVTCIHSLWNSKDRWQSVLNSILYSTCIKYCLQKNKVFQICQSPGEKMSLDRDCGGSNLVRASYMRGKHSSTKLSTHLWKLILEVCICDIAPSSLIIYDSCKQWGYSHATKQRLTGCPNASHTNGHWTHLLFIRCQVSFHLKCHFVQLNTVWKMDQEEFGEFCLMFIYYLIDTIIFVTRHKIDLRQIIF